MDSFGLYRTLVLALTTIPVALAQGPPAGGGGGPPPCPTTDWSTSPPYEWLFEDELPIPPVKEAKDYGGVSYYEFVVKSFSKQFYKDGRGATPLVGYDGMLPGPTIKQKRGVNSVLRVINDWNAPTVTHLHGSYSRAPFDGWAEDLIDPGQFKDYYYPNGQTGRTIWYHDHAMNHTAEHNWLGQFGIYEIVDDDMEANLGLPSGKFDVPLSLTSHQFNEDGTLWSPEANNERLSVYGDVIMVNGQPWPKMTVEPRKYRFRLLDAAVSRSFLLYMVDDGPVKGGKSKGHYKSVRPGKGKGKGKGQGQFSNSTEEVDPEDKPRIPFTVVASDSGFLESSVEVEELYLSMAERYEIIIDFSKYKGKKITLMNMKGFANDCDFIHTDKVMQFHVKSGHCRDDSVVPSSLVEIDYPRPGTDAQRTFVFNGAPGVGWTINGVRFDDVANRILAKPERGASETWTLVNQAPGWSHPIHVHLVDFRILSRSGRARGVFPYEALGLKDTVWLAAGESVVVEAIFSPWEGVYMFHCHNLVHEDHAMMAAFNVSLLEGFGYEENMHFVDPLDPEYAAQDCNPADAGTRSGAFTDEAIAEVIGGFEGTGAYGDIDGVETALETYWAGQKRDLKDLAHSAKFRS